MTKTITCLTLAVCAGVALYAQDFTGSVRLAGYRVLFSHPSGGGTEVVAEATVVNPGAAIPQLSAVVESVTPGIVIEAGTLNFGAIAAAATSNSLNTFVYRTTGPVALTPANLKITFSSTASAVPLASAGFNRVAKPGTPVVLSGDGSTSPSGKPLTYIWGLASQPTGSHATLAQGTGVRTGFTPDLAGQYTAQLIVHDGSAASPVAAVVIGASATVPPSATADSRPLAGQGGAYVLSGAASSDANGSHLTYDWTLLSTPPNSSAALDNTGAVTPRLTPDQPGDYVAQVVVHNGNAASSPAVVTLHSPVAEPTANAGRALPVPVGRQVHLDGTRSIDPQGLPLTYHWDLIAAPAGSNAALSDSSSATPNFLADVPGTYVAQLVVNNGTLASRASTVTATTQSVPPVANPGPNQLAGAGTAVQLDGSGSTDQNGLMLTFQWSLVGIPEGSLAALSSTTAVRPVFALDLPGTYIAQLIVSDSELSSAPAQVIVSTTAIPPTANAGPAQQVTTGTQVTLDGSASTDPNGLQLTYAWTLLSIPQGSSATLSGADTVSPTFTVDVAGNYVAQLMVSDSDYSSAPATVLITTGDLPPIANAGSNDTVPLPGVLVTLNGTGSTDPQQLPLTYSWSFITIPPNSSAVLSNPTAASPTFTADQPGLYIAQLIVNDGVQSSLPVTVAINGQFPAAISISLENSSLLSYASTLGDVHISNPAMAGNGACNGQVVQISLDNGSLGTLSTPSANPATSVCIPVGLEDAAFTLSSNSAIGGTTLTGFAENFQTGNTGFDVSARQVTMTYDTTTIGQGRTANGTLMLAQPVPNNPLLPNGVTYNLASSLPAIGSVSPASVTFAQGQTTANFQVSGLSLGQPIISATPTPAGYGSASQTITVLSPALTITIPHNLTVGPGQTQPFPISIGAAASSTVTVNLGVTAGPGNATFSPANVTIPAGSTSPTTQPTITGTTLGPLTVTASATGYAPDIEQENVSVTLSLSPGSVNVLTSATATMTLSASETAPAGGLVVTLTLSPTGYASVPATATIPQGKSSVKFKVTGVAGGAATLTAGGTGYVAATSSIQVAQAPPISFSGNCPSSLGYNGMSYYSIYYNPCTPYLSAPAPAGGETVTVTSSDPTLVTISLNSNTTGSKSVTLSYAGGSSSPSSGALYLAALASTGAATITATAPGYSAATFTVTLTPSGFTLSGGGQTTPYSGPSDVSVSFVSLDPTTLTYTGILILRPGATAATIRLADSNSRVGTLAATAVSVASGQYYATTTFNPIKQGTSTISIASAPKAYATASSGTTTQFTVVAPTISFSGDCPSSLGYNGLSYYSVYYSPCTPYLGAPAPTGGVTMTVSSSNAALVTISLDPSTAGSRSVTLSYAGGSTSPSSGALYLAALGSSGTATLTASAPGYTAATFTVTLTPSGFILSGGGQTTPYSGPTDVTASFVSLDPTSLTNTGILLLRPGAASATVRLSDSNNQVGKLAATSITIASGQYYSYTTYTPAKAGTSTISIASAPKAYATPSSGTTTQFTVVAPNISFNGNCPGTLGYNGMSYYSVYYSPCTPILDAPAPAGGEVMTVTSSDSTLVTISLSPSTVGGKSVTLNYAGGNSSPSNGALYLAALASSGTVTIKASAPGFNTATFTVTLTPSGFTLSGGGQTTLYSGPSDVSVSFVSLDPSALTYTGILLLRPGAPQATVNLANSNTGVGTLGSTSVTISSGSYYNSTTFTPVQVGTATISIPNTPAGYATPASGTTTQFTIVAPNISFNGYCPSSLGYNGVSYYSIYYSPCTPILGAPAPTGGETMTVTSSNPSLVTISLSPTTTGSKTVTLNYPAGYSSPTNGGLYLAGLASSGTATITATAPGFNTATFTVTLTPSGFILSGGGQVTTFSGPTSVSASFVSLDPTSLNSTGILILRPGAAQVAVNLTNSNTAVGALAANSIAITPGNYYNSTTFTPAQSGTATIAIASTPSGYATPYSGTSTQFTVVAPNISFNGQCPSTLGYNGMSYYSIYYSPCTPVLGAPAPGAETVTVTSSNPSLVTIATDPSTVGSQSVTLNYPTGYSSPQSGALYLAALANSGTVTITASAPGFNTATFTVTLTPSGFTLSGGGQTTIFSGPSYVTASFVSLDPTSMNSTGILILRPGASTVTVSLADSNTAVGTLAANSISISPGTYYNSTSFNPVSAGTATVSIPSAPTGYTMPFSGTTTEFTITAPTIGVVPVTVGQNLMTTTYGQLGVGAPSDNYAVTISVANSSQLLISSTGTDAGTTSLTFNFSQGQTQTPQFWVYGIGSPGAATLNITASSESGTGTITIDPSGFVFQNQNFSTTVAAAPTTLYIAPSALDPQYLSQVAIQQLRPGMTNTQVTVTLTDQSNQCGGNTPVGQITVNPVIFNGADNPNQQITSFQPTCAGQTLLQLTSPGFSASSSEVTATVTQ